ncbi:hypothetical protein UA75_29270 [Actinoalloteichus sp. GBA129-24]|nr:hypothetical protein UA75_29270 [Actinoalloteichus sp. GBA129-24]
MLRTATEHGGRRRLCRIGVRLAVVAGMIAAVWLVGSASIGTAEASDRSGDLGRSAGNASAGANAGIAPRAGQPDEPRPAASANDLTPSDTALAAARPVEASAAAESPSQPESWNQTSVSPRPADQEDRRVRETPTPTTASPTAETTTAASAIAAAPETSEATAGTASVRSPAATSETAPTPGTGTGMTTGTAPAGTASAAVQDTEAAPTEHDAEDASQAVLPAASQAAHAEEAAELPHDQPGLPGHADRIAAICCSLADVDLGDQEIDASGEVVAPVRGGLVEAPFKQISSAGPGLLPDLVGRPDMQQTAPLLPEPVLDVPALLIPTPFVPTPLVPTPLVATPFIPTPPQAAPDDSPRPPGPAVGHDERDDQNQETDRAAGSAGTVAGRSAEKAAAALLDSTTGHDDRAVASAPAPGAASTIAPPSTSAQESGPLRRWSEQPALNPAALSSASIGTDHGPQRSLQGVLTCQANLPEPTLSSVPEDEVGCPTGDLSRRPAPTPD